MKPQITVLKFGSSVLRNEDDLPSVVHEIYRAWRNGAQVVAVVSAFGDTTNQLLRRAETICREPDGSALATLLATGEAASSALLALALNKAGIPARLLDSVQIGLRTVGSKLDAQPVAVDSARLLTELQRAVVVLPGFVGRGDDGGTTLLGRGGSDFSALFLAHKLQGHCVLLKDVDGLYTGDPAVKTLCTSRFSEVSYDSAIRVGGAVVQQKAVRYAAANKLRFTVTSIGAPGATEVGPFSDQVDRSRTATEPLRVALLGCGTVGGGVYERLAALPDLFTVTGVGARTGKTARTAGVPHHLVTDKLDKLIDHDCDVVVELIGTADYPSELARRALLAGRHFVTANKALMAIHGDQLSPLATARGVELRYSAAVGGALPALEAIDRVRRLGPIKSFSGVLNSTTNYVLDRVAEGQGIDDAVRDAQCAGYAESNPQVDLNGTDATHKLVLLARQAFDVSLPLDAVKRTGIEGIDPAFVRQRARTVRLVAECSRNDGVVEATVKPVDLPLTHPLAQVRNADNCLVIEQEGGEKTVISAKGAGRWPTTEAVMADLLDLRRRTANVPEELEACA